MNKESHEGQSHSTLLGVFVHDIMNQVRNCNLKLDAIAISNGPGSYTGLRIGVSEAKGLSYGLGIPMIAIPTPNIMATIMKDKVEEDTLLCPMIDARRMEVYATIFDNSLNIIRNTSADIVDSNSYNEILEMNKIVFFGNGSEKCKEVLTHHNAIFIEGIHPLARAMGILAEKAFRENDFVNSAYFEPFYLKEFVATIPKNKII
jgi:tRNA threonylcarbamoyladenosine biosynthesis protein TsaB